MNDRHRTLARFYRRHHDIYMMEMWARVQKWTGEVVYEWQKYVYEVISSVKIEKLKGSLKEGNLER